MFAETSMPAQWRLETLGNLAHYINGRAFKPEDWGETGLPIIRIEQINNPDAEYDYFEGVIAPDHVIEDGDLLFSWSATLTTLVWDRGPAVLNQHIFKVVPKQGTDRNYLHHQLDYLIEGLAGQSHGSTMKHIKKSDLLPYPVHIPPFPEQRHIAKILDTADRAIEETEVLISKLKHIKTGLIHDLLTRGLDEHGHLRDPEAHPEQFKDSPLGRIPREWDVCKVDSVCERITDGSHQAVKTASSGLPFLFVSCIRDGRILWNQAARITPQTFKEISRGREPKRGLILYTAVGSYGHAALVRENRPFSFQRHIAYVLPNSAKIGPEFLVQWLNGDWCRSYADRVAIGNAQKTVTLGELSSFPVPEQHRIAEIIDSYDARIRAEEAYRDKLKLEKRGLMEDLLTGRVRVKAAQEVGS